MSKRMVDYWVIPPEHDAEFVACMEEVLDTYKKPYDPEQPVICMDEQPVQLIKETRQPIEATPDHPRRVDYEYERNGEHFSVRRASVRVPSSDGAAAANQVRLGSRGERSLSRQ